MKWHGNRGRLSTTSSSKQSSVLWFDKVTVTVGNWETHGNGNGSTKRNAPMTFKSSISSFLNFQFPRGSFDLKGGANSDNSDPRGRCSLARCVSATCHSPHDEGPTSFLKLNWSFHKALIETSDIPDCFLMNLFLLKLLGPC
jgi:hypothetical protein